MYSHSAERKVVIRRDLLKNEGIQILIDRGIPIL